MQFKWHCKLQSNSFIGLQWSYLSHLVQNSHQFHNAWHLKYLYQLINRDWINGIIFLLWILLTLGVEWTKHNLSLIVLSISFLLSCFSLLQPQRTLKLLKAAPITTPNGVFNSQQWLTYFYITSLTSQTYLICVLLIYVTRICYGKLQSIGHYYFPLSFK